MVGVPLRRVDRRRWTARPPGAPAREPLRAATRTCRRCSSSAAPQGARSINLAVAGAAKALAAAGVQVLHVIGARNEPVDDPERPAGART